MILQRTRRWIVPALVLLQAGTVTAHETTAHYHLPGRMDLTGAEPTVVAAVLAINAVAWLLMLRAVQRFREER